jgi:hypothetical protein
MKSEQALFNFSFDNFCHKPKIKRCLLDQVFLAYLSYIVNALFSCLVQQKKKKTVMELIRKNHSI